MYQVALRIWNEIAQSQPLSPPWSEVFRATSLEQLATLLKPIEAKLAAQGADNRVTLAYRLVAPLLLENEAISAHLLETNDLSLRTSLPEVLTVNEAVILASKEYPLKPSQQQKLAELLRQAYQPQQSSQRSAPQTA